MPIRTQSDLPAKEIWSGEYFRYGREAGRAIRISVRFRCDSESDAFKEDTELQLLRFPFNTPLQVDVTFVRVSSHEAKNTSTSHLNKFYVTFDEIKIHHYDGLIITGAPVEQMEFEEVDYWEELVEIMDWSKKNVTSTLHLCWAQAGLYHHFGLKKRMLKEKMFGLFLASRVQSEDSVGQRFDDLSGASFPPYGGGCRGYS